MKSISEFKKLGLGNFNNDEWLLVKGSSKNIMGGSVLSTGCTLDENGWICCSDVAKDN